MLQIPASVIRQFTAFITQKGIPNGQQGYYPKWVRFYLDFCHKYNFKQGTETSLLAFAKKLDQKKQPLHLQKQAEQAVKFYFEFTVFSQEKTEKPQHRGKIPNRDIIVPTTNYNNRQEYNKLDLSQARATKTGGGVENKQKSSGADWVYQCISPKPT